jgi:hypothetical protein
MKKRMLLTVLILVCLRSNAQYFKNSKYYSSYMYYLFSIYTIDSLELLSNDNGIENYQMKKHQTENSLKFKTVNFKIQDSVIYFKLNENKDSSYYPYYNLKLKKNDSFYMYSYNMRTYNLSSSQVSNARIDSMKVYVGDTVTQFVNSRTYLTREIIHPNNNKIYFFDGLGFNATLHSGFDIPNTTCICSDDLLLYNTTEYSNDLCLLDSFVARFHSEFGSIYSLNKNQYFKFFPNPASKTFQIEISANREFAEIEIYNCFGECVFKQNINESNSIFEISNLSSGLYSIQMKLKEQIVTDKLIIEK